MNAKLLSFRRSYSTMVALFFGLVSVASASAQTPTTEFAGIKIKNFGKMDDRFYRGAQPKEGDYTALAALGVNTVIDLRDDPTSYEKRLTEAAGMRYVNIPMDDTKRPRDEQVAQFLKLVDDPATGVFYVHCVGGRHRTGAMGAVYRYTHDGWTYDQVYKEMKDYDFYTRMGHGVIKDFVRDYYSGILASERAKTPVVVSEH